VTPPIIPATSRLFKPNNTAQTAIHSSWGSTTRESSHFQHQPKVQWACALLPTQQWQVTIAQHSASQELLQYFDIVQCNIRTHLSHSCSATEPITRGTVNLGFTYMPTAIPIPDGSATSKGIPSNHRVPEPIALCQSKRDKRFPLFLTGHCSSACHNLAR
jgi:hypothetical protein